MKQLEAFELPIGKVFSADYDFVIPNYQRPYAWEQEQALQLLDDLRGALERDTDDPYFLGSIVLVKDKGSARAEVIDGQQRLTTLTILLAVLRELAQDDEVRTELRDLIREPGSKLAGLKAKPRLTLRARDSEFFAAHVQEPGRLESLLGIDDHSLGNDSQRAVRDNARALHKVLSAWDDDVRQDLAALIQMRTYLVIVGTPDLTSAHRIFSVMNARGLDLTPPDIFKSKVIGALPEDLQDGYAAKWEDAEERLGRESFGDLFLHLRLIVSKRRAGQELLHEFDEQVLSRYLPSRAAEFADELLFPYAQAYERLVKRHHGSGSEWSAINVWLHRLDGLDNQDWRPPALWALRHLADEPAVLEKVLARLERLAATMFIRRLYGTPRIARYIELLKQFEEGWREDAPAFELGADEIRETMAYLDGDVYLVRKTVKFILQRLDESLANVPGATYDHDIVSVEHVLPQSPPDGSQWRANFSEEDHDVWVHRLANLVLLNRRKNSEAQNYDFMKKKERYFTGSSGVSTFALTVGVIESDEWTTGVLRVRQERLLRRLVDEWELHEQGDN